MEQWREVPGWPEYSVSDMGRVRREIATKCAKAGRILKAVRRANGYAGVVLVRGSEKRTAYVHRLVAEAFLGDPTGFDVCHNDGVRNNNVLSNLRIDTRKDNLADTAKHGTKLIGERVNGARYTSDVIRDIRRRYSEGARIADISRSTGINYGTVCDAVNRKTWRHL